MQIIFLFLETIHCKTPSNKIGTCVKYNECYLMFNKFSGSMIFPNIYNEIRARACEQDKVYSFARVINL